MSMVRQTVDVAKVRVKKAYSTNGAEPIKNATFLSPDSNSNSDWRVNHLAIRYRVKYGEKPHTRVIDIYREWLTLCFDKPAFVERLLIEGNIDDLSSDGSSGLACDVVMSR